MFSIAANQNPHITKMNSYQFAVLFLAVAVFESVNGIFDGLTTGTVNSALAIPLLSGN